MRAAAAVTWLMRAAAAIMRRAVRQLSFGAARQLQFWRAALQLQLCLLVRARAAPQVHLLGMLRFSCS
jgi:hypothetical protein